MDETRKAFEAWATAAPRGWRITRFDKSDGLPWDYCNYPVERAWEAWQAASAAEREACAKVCESPVGGDRWSDNGTEAADAIRARGQK